MTLGRKWNLFAFAITGIGLMGFSAVYGIVLLTSPSATVFQLAWGWFFVLGFGFFAVCVIIGGVRWARTGSPYPGGKVDPLVASGRFAYAADTLNRGFRVNGKVKADDGTP